jgi:two-component system CheB/CheR fusion protein
MTANTEGLEARLADVSAALHREHDHVHELEERLQIDENKLRILDEGLRDYAVIQLEPDGRIAAWSRGAERVLGYTADEVVGHSFKRLFPPEEVAEGRPEKELETARRHGHASDEGWQVARNGVRIWVTGLTVPLSQDAAEGFLKVLRNETERRRVEEALRESEHRLRVALGAARMGIWHWDITRGSHDIDENTYRLFGLPADGSIRTLGEFCNAIHPADRKAVAATFERCIRDGAKLDIEFRVIWPDDSVHWLKDQGDTVYDDSGKLIYMSGAILDITEHKAMETAARRRAQELADDDRRKDEFLAMLGHELRNPLAPIRNAAQILKILPQPDPESEKAREMIERQVDHLTHLVDDLMDVSRITRGKIRLNKQALELRAILERAAEASRPVIESRRHTFHMSISPGLWVEADDTRLTQVVGNLLNNAAKYTEEGGEIWLSARQEDGEAVIRVRDNGIGIAPEMLPHLFEPFTQATRSLDRAQGGLGLGLTVVKRLVELHGGRVDVYSPGLGRGSEFIVRLRALSDSEIPAETGRPNGAAIALPRRVLIVDDNVDAAESLATVLRLSGHEVYTVHDGAAALTVAEDVRPEVVLLDIGLPGMNGFEVAKQLRARTDLAHMMLVALTGYGQEEDRQRSLAAGFDHHLVKPVAVWELERLMRSLERS